MKEEASEEQEGVGCCQIFFCVRIDTSIEVEEGWGVVMSAVVTHSEC